MKMKLRTRIAAALTAVVMSLSMMMTSASAAETTWSVYYTRSTTQPGAPYQSQRTYKIAIRPTYSTSYFKTQCTAFSSGKDSIGDLRYATVYARRCDPRGIDLTIIVSANYNHRSKDSGYIRRNLSTKVDYGYELWVDYTLNGPSTVLGSISGKIYYPYGAHYIRN